MTRLLKTIDIPDSVLKLLLGPFAQWYHASNKDKGITKRISARALQTLCNVGYTDTKTFFKEVVLPNKLPKGKTWITSLKHYTTSVKYQAATRVEMLWSIYTKYRTHFNEDSMFAYYCGVLMDIHQPLLQHTQRHPIRIHEAYERRLAPEQVTIKNIICADYLGTHPAVMEYVWLQYIRECADITKSPFEVNKPSRKGKKKKKTAAQKIRVSTTNTTPFSISLMCPLKESKPPTFFDFPQNPRLFMQIMKKGILGTNSTRYIDSRMQSALVTESHQNMIIVRMVKMFFLGAYKDATIIAPPNKRIRIYLDGYTDVYYHTLKTLSPKELHAVIAEHLIAAAQQNSALHSILSADPEWIEYRLHSMAVCNRYLRANMYGKVIGLKTIFKKSPRATVHATNAVATPSAVFWTLANMVGPIKHKIPLNVLSSAAKGMRVGFHQFYETLQKQTSNCCISRGVLEEIGVRQDDIDYMMEESYKFKKDKLKKRIRTMIKNINPHTVHVLYLYMHYMIRRSKFAPLPVQHDIDDISMKGKQFPSIKVCTRCFSICTQTRSATGNSHKSKEGIYIDTVNDTTDSPGMCMCTSTNLIDVSLKQTRFMGVTVNSPVDAKIITRCHACDVATVYKYVIGTTDLCQKCYYRIHRELEARVCVCGKSFTTKTPAQARLLARNKEGNLSMYALCNKHVYLLHHVFSYNVPITYYQNIIPSNERHFTK